MTTLPQPLIREKIQLPTETIINKIIDEETVNLAKKASKLLFYSHLQSKISQNESRISNPPNLDLEKAIIELGIEPFNIKTVGEYKEQQIKEKSYTWPNIIEGISGLATFAFLASLIIIGIILAWTHSETFGCIFGANGVLLIISFIICVNVENVLGKNILASWKRVRIGSYDKEIPEFALQTAVDIKEKCPSAEFYIDELILKETPLKDPFLIVSNAGKEFYIEVWNEPTFTKV